MSKASPGLIFLRALAIFVAVMALAGWVIFSSIHAPGGKSRTRASSSKAQTSSATIHKWLQATESTHVQAQSGDDEINATVEYDSETYAVPSDGGTEEVESAESDYFPGTKTDRLISPEQLSELWTGKLGDVWKLTPRREGEAKPGALLEAKSPDDLQTSDIQP